ncbi:MAG: hypothetical protein FWF08_02930, partial [Oscillospiraceae bacterium]|nr:hypothetical protein [Oscillospiraceae bacterium]
MLSNPGVAVSGVKNGLALCGGVLIPSLFPFMALSGFISLPQIAEYAGRPFEGLCRALFALPGVCAPVILLSLTGGYPVGARMTAALCGKGLIGKNEARRMLDFCVNSGPAFTVAAIGAVMLGSARAGFLLFASCCVSSLAIGMAGRFFSRENAPVKLIIGKSRRGGPLTRPAIRTKSGAGTRPASTGCGNTQKYDIPILKGFTQAVSGAAEAMISVCSWVILFSALTSLLNGFINNRTLLFFINYFFEVGSGAEKAAVSGNIRLAAAVLGFGGFSVAFQVLPYVSVCGASFFRFLRSRAIHSVAAYGAMSV